MATPDPTLSKSALKSKKATAKKSAAPGDKRARMSRRAADAPAVASPAAAGPSGASLEAHVGAQYLLPLLSGGEARGLPGIVVTRVAFQRAALAHPMDDVIVTGVDQQGRPATLELQAKRTITFTAHDRVFADVVAMACRAAAKPEFDTQRYELAVAIARTSTRIERYIQDVLRWAREYQEPQDFFRRLELNGAAHQAMRDFVGAFRAHMNSAGAAHSDAAVLRLLSRFQVLAFDFEQPGSVCAQLARERCVQQLAPPEAGRAGELWDSLRQIALRSDATGGDLDAAALRMQLAGERGYRLAGHRRLYLARERLAEISESALADIRTSVRGVMIDRAHLVATAHLALEQGRYLEIRGAGGVGKSAVLKDLAHRMGIESCVAVLAPNRVPGGGWAAQAAQLSCDVSAREFLTDLAGDGGGTLFIDGIDRFDAADQRATISDFIRAAAQVPGFRVVVTTRGDLDADARAWLPEQAMQQLGAAPPLVIHELGEDDVAQLRDADPALSGLLRPGHPAEKLVRNLYRLDRLARAETASALAPLSEAEMAWQWWMTGDAADPANQLDRKRILRSLAVHSLESSAALDTGNMPASSITALIKVGSLRALNAVCVEPEHDVLRDWAIGCLLYEEPNHFTAFKLVTPVPARLMRGLELAARLQAERGFDAMPWRAVYDLASVPGAHGSWRRTVLLALARTERAHDVLNRCLPVLAANHAELLADLVRAAIAIDSESAVPLWTEMGADTSRLTDDFAVPRGPAWLNLITWSLTLGDQLPHAAVPQFVDLYSRWCRVFAGKDALSPRMVALLYAWLVEVDAGNRRAAPRRKPIAGSNNPPGLSMTAAQERDLRTAFLLSCKARPADAESYLLGMVNHPRRHVLFRDLLTFVGTAPHAAPKALADLFLRVLPEGDDSNNGDGSGRKDVFSAWDLEFFPASPARAPFFDLLQASKEHGLRLVRGVVAHAIRRRTGGRKQANHGIEISLRGGRRTFPWHQSYIWSRPQDSSIVTSALMALEGWAHLRIEYGEPVQDVIDAVLGPDGSPAAFLCVAVDVMLSHLPKTRECLWPFALSADLLAMDCERFDYDVLNGDSLDNGWVRPEPVGSVRLHSLLSRPSRGLSLDSVLREETVRIESPHGENSAVYDARIARQNALNQLDDSGNICEGADRNDQQDYKFARPADEAPLQAELTTKTLGDGVDPVSRLRLMHVLTKPPCPVQLLEQSVRWANCAPSASDVEPDENDREWIESSRFIVAALVIRDGSRDMKAEYGPWASSLLAEAATCKADDGKAAGRMVRQLPYNAAAIAAVGFLAAARTGSDMADLPRLLHLASRHETGMASVLRVETAAQRALRPELTQALLRLGMASAIFAVWQHRDGAIAGTGDYVAQRQALEAARQEIDNVRLSSAVEAELRWLRGNGQEPMWPELPQPAPFKRRPKFSMVDAPVGRKQFSAPQRVFDLDSTAAAHWLSLAVDLWRVERPELLRAFVRHCWSWTAGANGVGCEPEEEPGERAFDWNIAYFQAALTAAVSADGAGLDEYLLDPLAVLPEERFLDAAESALHALDYLWLNGVLVSDHTAVAIRHALSQRLVVTRFWLRLASELSVGISSHGAGAVSAMFMGRHEMGRGPRCYVLPPGTAHADLLLPSLTRLAEQAAGSTFVALAFLGLLEVAPHESRLEFLARAVAAWWRVQGANAEFWIHYAIGRRVGEWIDKALLSSNASRTFLESAELIAIVDILVQCGTPAAGALDERLSARRRASEN